MTWSTAIPTETGADPQEGEEEEEAAIKEDRTEAGETGKKEKEERTGGKAWALEEEWTAVREESREDGATERKKEEAALGMRLGRLGIAKEGVKGKEGVTKEEEGIMTTGKKKESVSLGRTGVAKTEGLKGKEGVTVEEAAVTATERKKESMGLGGTGSPKKEGVKGKESLLRKEEATPEEKTVGATKREEEAAHCVRQEVTGLATDEGLVWMRGVTEEEETVCVTGKKKEEASGVTKRKKNVRGLQEKETKYMIFS